MNASNRYNHLDSAKRTRTVKHILTARNGVGGYIIEKSGKEIFGSEGAEKIFVLKKDKEPYKPYDYYILYKSKRLKQIQKIDLFITLTGSSYNTLTIARNISGKTQSASADVKSVEYSREQDQDEITTNKVNLETLLKSINPELKEHKGYDFAKKYYDKQKSINEDEQKVLNLLEANPFRFELAGTFTPAEVTPQVADGSIDGPASASLIAKTLKMSPMAVQEILDRAVRMGTITRVGDAYSYGKVEVQ